MLGRERNVLSSVVESSPHAVYWKDLQLRYIGYNKKFADLVDEASSWSSSSYLEKLDEEEQEIVETAGETHFDFDLGPQAANSPRWLRTRLTTMRNARNKPIGLLGTLVDISSYKRTLQALRKSDGQLRQLLKQLPLRLWLVDQDLNLMQCHWSANQTPWIPWNSRRISLFELFESSEESSLPIQMARRALSGESPRFELNLQRKSYLVCMEPLKDESAKIIGALAISVEVGEITKSMSN